MKPIVLKIASVILALLVVLATTTIAMEVHWCCNKLVGWSISGEADLCVGEVRSAGNLDMQCAIGGDECCKNLNGLKVGEQIVEDSHNIILESPSIEIHSNFNVPEIDINIYPSFITTSTYNPPLLIRDLRILHESYLL